MAGLAALMHQGWFCHQLAAPGKISRLLKGGPYRMRIATPLPGMTQAKTIREGAGR